MTKDEALTMCLEYIETDKHERKYVRHAIKAALEQPEQEPEQEPVISAWSLREVYFDEDGEPSMHRSPPAAQRPWVELTEFQFAEIYNKWNDTNGSTPWGLNQALEAKLKELNK